MGTATPHETIQDRSIQYRRRASTLLAVIQVTFILAITVVAIGLPGIRRDLDLLPGQLALVSTGYGLAFSGLLLLGGRLADVFRPRRMLLIGLIVFGIASIGVGTTPGFVSALASRLGQGVGAALGAPAAMVLLRALYPEPAEHATAVARWGALEPIGATAGILISGLAVTIGSWRVALAIPVVVAGLGVAAGRRLLPEAAPMSSRGIDLPGGVLAAVGIGSVSYGLATVADHGWSSPIALATLTAGVVALSGFGIVESASRAPLAPPTFLRSPGRPVALCAVMIAAAAHASAGFFLALYFQQVRGMSALTTTAAFLPFLLALPLAGMVTTRLLRAVQPLLLVAAGLGITAAGLAAVGTITVVSSYAGMTLVGLLLLPTGVAMTFAASTLMAVDGADHSRGGLAAGLLNTAVELGPALVLPGLVALASTRANELLEHGLLPEAAATSGYRRAFTAAAMVLGVSAAACTLLSRRSEPPRSQSTGHVTHQSDPTEKAGTP